MQKYPGSTLLSISLKDKLLKKKMKLNEIILLQKLSKINQSPM